MKDLTLKDIIVNPENPLTKLSVYFEGEWRFATVDTPTRSTETQQFYLISYPFRLVGQNQMDPTKGMRNGEAGSYAILDRDGSFSIATPAQYQQLFPRTLIDRPSPPLTSAVLEDPNYLTNTVRKQRNRVSNTIQVGANTFSNTVPKQTIVILPSGAQQAVLRDEPVDPFQNITLPEPEDEEPPPPLPGY
jgi:hypothetical protein